MSHADQLEILDPEVYRKAVKNCSTLKSGFRSSKDVAAAMRNGLNDCEHWFIWGSSSEGHDFWQAWNDFLNDPAPLERRIK